MPREASRYMLRLLAVDALRILDSLSELMAMQAGLNGPETFGKWWDEKHGSKMLRFNRGMDATVPVSMRPRVMPGGHRVISNPWAWRIQVERCDDGQ